MSLYIKHRPTDLNDIVGNAQTVESVRALLKRKHDDRPRAWLFTGPSGCGKTTIARIVAKAMGCSARSFKEYNIADFRGIDTARDLVQEMRNVAMFGDIRVYLLDEAHQATKDFQNALLKALEDTPKHVVFMLCTTEPDKIINTIRTRCTRFDVELLNDEQVKLLVNRTAKAEGKKIPNDVVDAICAYCGGSARQAMVILDKIIDLEPKAMAKAAEMYAATTTQSIELCRALMRRAKWAEVAKILKNIEDEPETVRRCVLGYANSVLLNGREDAKCALILECFKHPFYDIGKPGLTLAAFEVTAQ